MPSLLYSSFTETIPNQARNQEENVSSLLTSYKSYVQNVEQNIPKSNKG